MRTIAAFALAGALVLAACGDTADPVTEDTPAEPVEAPDRSAAEAEPMPDPVYDDGVLGSDAVAQGQWFAKTERGVPQALFGPPRTEANFLVRCEGDELAFVRSLPIDGDRGEMTLMAGGESRTITATERPGPVPQTTGRLAASDAFAATLAQTTQPIAVRLGDGPSFRMPAHEYLRDVVANCRS